MQVLQGAGIFLILLIGLAYATDYYPNTIIMNRARNVTNATQIYLNGTPLDQIFLKLDASNDPITGELYINNSLLVESRTKDITLNVTNSTTWNNINLAGQVNLYNPFAGPGSQHWKFYPNSGVVNNSNRIAGFQNVKDVLQLIGVGDTTSFTSANWYLSSGNYTIGGNFKPTTGIDFQNLGVGTRLNYEDSGDDFVFSQLGGTNERFIMDWGSNTLDFKTDSGISKLNYIFSDVVFNTNIQVGQFILHEGDADTYFLFGTDSITMNAGGLSGFKIEKQAGFPPLWLASFNPGGADFDFNVKGGTDNMLIYANAGTDLVGIGTNNPSYKLTVNGTLMTNDDLIFNNGKRDIFNISVDNNNITKLRFVANKSNDVGFNFYDYDVSTNPAFKVNLPVMEGYATSDLGLTFEGLFLLDYQLNIGDFDGVQNSSFSLYSPSFGIKGKATASTFKYFEGDYLRIATLDNAIVDKSQDILIETGTVKINGNLNVSGNFTGNQIYGQMYYHNYTATSLNFAVQSTYYPLWFVNSSEKNGFTFEGGWLVHSNLTAQYSGLYQLNFYAVGSGQNNHEYHLVPFKNSDELEQCEVMKQMSAGGDITPMNGNCLVRLTVGDRINIRISDYSGTGAGNYYGGNVNLVRVGN